MKKTITKNITNLRKLDWADLIVYFIELESKEDFGPKDLVDFFHFQYMRKVDLGRWITPSYIREVPRAKIILNLYGKDYSISLVKILFEKYREIFRKEFNEIIWSLGIISSEKTGFLMERAMIEIKKEGSNERLDILEKLNKKDRDTWTSEDNMLYHKLIKGEL